MASNSSSSSAANSPFSPSASQLIQLPDAQNRHKDLKDLLYDLIECLPPEVLAIIVDYESYEFQGKYRTKYTAERNSVSDVAVISEDVVAIVYDSRDTPYLPPSLKMRIWNLRRNECVSEWRFTGGEICYCAGFLVSVSADVFKPGNVELLFHVPQTGDVVMSFRCNSPFLPLRLLLPHLPSDVTDAFICASIDRKSLVLWTRAPSHATQFDAKYSGMKDENEWKRESDDRKCWHQQWAIPLCTEIKSIDNRFHSWSDWNWRNEALIHSCTQIDASYFAVSLFDHDSNRIQIWQLDANESQCHLISEFQNKELGLKFVSNSPVLIYQRLGSHFHDLYVHDVQRPSFNFDNAIYILAPQELKLIAEMCMFENGQMVTAEMNGRIRLWDLSSRECVKEWDWNSLDIFSNADPEYGSTSYANLRLRPLPNGHLLIFDTWKAQVVELY